MRKRLTFRKFFAATSILSTLSLLGGTSAVAATSLSDLQKQQAQLKQQAAQAKQQAAEQKALADRAASNLQQVTTQITAVTHSIQDTVQQAQNVQGQIGQKSQSIAELESQLTTIRTQQDALVRELYIMAAGYSNELAFLSNDSLSKEEERKARFNSLEKAAIATYARTKAAMDEVTAARDQLQRKNDQLAELQSQQQNQQRVLADAQQTQQSLRNNAVVAEQQLEAQAADAQAKANKIAQQIQILTSTSSWGNQIVSSDDGSWYYSQTGDGTKMGNGPYTVSEVGCLITSIAMVATYYGHNISPDYIARNGVFSNGYLISLPSNLGITRQSTQSVNWGTVNNELANNRPVIVSIYLPSVGAVNADGSSHFIVLKGVSDGKYLMHDPIGPGRSYNLNQVRSMILVSNN